MSALPLPCAHAKDQKKMTNSATPTPPSKPRSALSALLRFFRLRSHSASFFNSTGLARSFRENRPVNKDGEPLPWLNYSLIRLLDERLRETLRVFEYGSGYSTLYFAARTQSVTSVEHVPEWVQELQPYLPDNAMLATATPGPEYIQAPYAHEPFDLILVDGLDRVECVHAAIGALRPEGVIVLDDTHRPEYQRLLAPLREQGYKTLTLYGPKPTSIIEAQSTIIYRTENVLGL